MIGYRSIGYEEFSILVKANNPVYGRRCWKGFDYTTCSADYGVVCFFQEPYYWHDKKHVIDIQVDLKNPILGVGTYMSAKSFEKTRIWTGREGKTKYELPEAYVRCYWPKQIMKIDLHNKYANWFVREKVIPFCKKYHIELLQDGVMVWSPASEEKTA